MGWAIKTIYKTFGVSVWVKLFVNKKTHFVASWYRPPVDGHLPLSDNGNDLLNSLEKFDNLFREQLDTF